MLMSFSKEFNLSKEISIFDINLHLSILLIFDLTFNSLRLFDLNRFYNSYSDLIVYVHFSILLIFLTFNSLRLFNLNHFYKKHSYSDLFVYVC